MNETVARYLTHLAAERRLSPHTVESYQRDLASLLELAQDTDLQALDSSQIRHFIARLHGQGLSAKSLARRLFGRGITKEVVSTATGRYTAPFLPTGEYEIVFALAGFKTSTAKGIVLHVNDRLEVNGTLGVGELTDTVEVSAAAQMIQPTPAVQNLMGSTQVQELPLNNRNFVQLATLVPGVNSSLPDEVGIGLTSTVSLSMAGARRNAVNWFVDGASNVDVGSNITLLSTPTLESIEEFKIITSSYAAEWPRGGGGIVNVVTKGGTNTFRASAYEFYRNDSLNANSFIRNKNVDRTISQNPPKLDYNNFGYTVAVVCWARAELLRGHGRTSARRCSPQEIRRSGQEGAETVGDRGRCEGGHPNHQGRDERQDALRARAASM